MPGTGSGVDAGQWSKNEASLHAYSGLIRCAHVIDFLATQDHYRAHLAPIYRALRDVEVVGHDGMTPLADDGTPTVIAGFGDLALVSESRPVAMLDHGVGQTYRDVPHGAYNGGRGRERISLFLYAGPLGAAVNEAAYPAAQHVVIGPALLDQLSCVSIQPVARKRLDSSTKPTVAFAWHWDLGIVPETRSAFAYYQPALARFAGLHDDDYRLIGHGHPRDWEVSEDRYRDLGIEPVRDPAEVLARADLVCFDNTSFGYEAAALGIPVLALDAPFFRPEVDHGLRFWSDVPGLRLMSHRAQRPEMGVVHAQWGRDNLAGAVAEALEDRAELRDLRAEVVGRVYAGLDGRAGVRGADALVAWAAKV